MIQKKIVSTLALWLLFLPVCLRAGDVKGIFNLKVGDWFEMQVEDPSRTLTDEKRGERHLYKFRYILEKQFDNGNQQYRIILERIKYLMRVDKDDFGYDSYYPALIDNRKVKERKNQYTMEVSSSGNIISLKTDADNSLSEVNLTQISPGKRYNISYVYTPKLQDSIVIAQFSKDIFVPLTRINFETSSQERVLSNIGTVSKDIMLSKILFEKRITYVIPFVKEQRVPLSIRKGDTDILLSDASFPISGNAVIKGEVQNLNVENISIINKANYKINANGTFYCPMLLVRPTLVEIGFTSNNIYKAFISPGDTLTMLINGNAIRYSGTAAFNTQLIQDVLDQISKCQTPYDLGAYSVFRNKISQTIKEIINKYEGKASSTCIDFIRTEFVYFLAKTKFNFLDQHINKNVSDYMKANDDMTRGDIRRPYNDSLCIISNYPPDFFQEADTMPILTNSYEKGAFFNDFIASVSNFKRYRLSMSIGSTNTYDFSDYYSLAKATLRGYPLYSSIAKLYGTSSMFRDYSNFLKAEPYYQSFINNCEDPEIIESIRKLHETIEQLAPGKQFPLHSLLLTDSSFFDLNVYKGKTLCILFLNGINRKDNLNEMREYIKKFNPKEVEFIFAIVSGSRMNGDASLFFPDMPNVKVIEVAWNGLGKLMIPPYPNRIFVMDKWFRIIEDNVQNPKNDRGIKLDEAIKKANSTTFYTKDEKASIYKIIGWSFGSILFTSLVGIWIYRIRIRRIKQQEAMKRQIKELEIKAIRSQMNPHFIFNALNSIQSLINANQFKEANIYLSKFAVLLRRVLHNSEQKLVPLSEELKGLELYCQLEQLRFEFKLEINMDADIHADLIEIPGMMIQPLAENAIIHGLKPKDGRGELDIHISQQNGNLHVSVLDNGVGLPSQNDDQLRQRGVGLKLVEERLKMLNLEGKLASLNIMNKNANSNTTGTIAELIIPID